MLKTATWERRQCGNGSSAQQDPAQSGQAAEAQGAAAESAQGESGQAKDSVIVTMPSTSEPEAGFDPVYGWGAGEHVHEPLIQSTLTTTTADLKIGKDLATDYSVSEDGLTWTVTIRNDVKFTDGEPLMASDVAFTYNLCVQNSSVNDFTMLKEAVALDDTTVEFHMNMPFPSGLIPWLLWELCRNMLMMRITGRTLLARAVTL